MSSRKMKLSLHTIFNHHSRPQHTRSRRTTAPVPTSACASLPRPHTPDHQVTTHSPGSATSSTATYSPATSLRINHRTRLRTLHLRRKPSAIDVALEAERCSTSVPENIGLRLLEPRPRAVSSTGTIDSIESVVSAESSLMESVIDFEGREVVLDGIFEVLERSR